MLRCLAFNWRGENGLSRGQSHSHLYLRAQIMNAIGVCSHLRSIASRMNAHSQSCITSCVDVLHDRLNSSRPHKDMYLVQWTSSVTASSLHILPMLCRSDEVSRVACRRAECTKRLFNHISAGREIMTESDVKSFAQANGLPVVYVKPFFANLSSYSRFGEPASAAVPYEVFHRYVTARESALKRIFDKLDASMSLSSYWPQAKLPSCDTHLQRIWAWSNTRIPHTKPIAILQYTSTSAAALNR